MLLHVNCYTVGTDHMLRIKFFCLAQTNYFYCTQNLEIKRLKIKRPREVVPLLISCICLLVVRVCVCPGACDVSKAFMLYIYFLIYIRLHTVA
jgi:hypothetical protein